MKAVIIAEPGKVEIIEKERPVPKDGEALLKVLYCGICGADVRLLREINRLPPIPEYPGMNFQQELSRYRRMTEALKREM